MYIYKLLEVLQNKITECDKTVQQEDLNYIEGFHGRSLGRWHLGLDPCVRKTLQSKEYEENIPSNGSITSEGLHPVRVRRSPGPPRRPAGLGSCAEQQRGTGCWRGGWQGPGCRGAMCTPWAPRASSGGDRAAGPNGRPERCAHPELRGRLQGGTGRQARTGLCKDAPEEDKEGNNEDRKEAMAEV